MARVHRHEHEGNPPRAFGDANGLNRTRSPPAPASLLVYPTLSQSLTDCQTCMGVVRRRVTRTGESQRCRPGEGRCVGRARYASERSEEKTGGCLRWGSANPGERRGTGGANPGSNSKNLQRACPREAAALNTTPPKDPPAANTEAPPGYGQGAPVVATRGMGYCFTVGRAPCPPLLTVPQDRG